MLSAGSTPKIPGLTVEQAEAVVRLSCLPAFKDLIAKVQADEVSGLGCTPAGQLSQGSRRRVHASRGAQKVVVCGLLTSDISRISPALPARRGGLCSTKTPPPLSPQQFSIWLDSSSPEQTVPHLWSEENPASKPRPGLSLSFSVGTRA